MISDLAANTLHKMGCTAGSGKLRWNSIWNGQLLVLDGDSVPNDELRFRRLRMESRERSPSAPLHGHERPLQRTLRDLQIHRHALASEEIEQLAANKPAR